MLRMTNKYCSNCLRTQRFLDLVTYLVCERCTKRLDRVDRSAARTPRAMDPTHPQEQPSTHTPAAAQKRRDAV